MNTFTLQLNAWLMAIPAFLVSFGGKLVAAAVVLFIGFQLCKLLIKAIGKSKAYSKLDESVGHFLISALRILIYAVVIICAASIIGIPATSFITILASAGVAIGLALQGSLSNVAGSIMILFFRPFKIGDFIEGNGVSGTVEDINLFYTVITTPDNKRITCPNGALSNGNITNYSAKDTRRVDNTFSVSNDSDIEKVKEIIAAVVQKNPLAMKDPAPFIAVSAHNATSIDFVVRAWCNRADYWNLHFAIVEGVKNEFDKQGIAIPRQKMDVVVNNK